MVALRRWQLLQREQPLDLQQIVREAGMNVVPRDPYGHGPLKMTNLDGDVVVYSIGVDGKDDRALADWKWGTQPGDYIFRLRKTR